MKRDPKAGRREVWQMLKREAPDHARFLEEVRRELGKPKHIRIMVKGKEVWRD